MNQIHYKDLMKLHQQTSNVLYRDLDLQHATTHKLRKSLESIATQYRLEKMVTQARNVKIRVLEKALLELSEDPRNIKHTQNLIKEKDREKSSEEEVEDSRTTSKSHRRGKRGAEREGGPD